LLGLLFQPEDKSDTFFRNIAWFSLSSWCYAREDRTLHPAVRTTNSALLFLVHDLLKKASQLTRIRDTQNQLLLYKRRADVVNSVSVHTVGAVLDAKQTRLLVCQFVLYAWSWVEAASFGSVIICRSRDYV
jgi:hypothetical protein